MKKYLDILWISYGLSLDEIKKAYLKKAFEYHPDRNHGFKKEAEEKLKEINIAMDYIQDHFSEYKNWGHSQASWNNYSSQNLKYNIGRTEANWTFFAIVVTFVCLTILGMASSSNSWPFSRIHKWFGLLTGGNIYEWVAYLIFNSYVLPVGVWLWVAFALSKNRTWKNIVIWLIAVSIWIMGYKLVKIQERYNIVPQYQINKIIEDQQKSSNTSVKIIPTPDLLLTELAPVITKVDHGLYNIKWREIEWAKAYSVSYPEEDGVSYPEEECTDTGKNSSGKYSSYCLLWDLTPYAPQWLNRSVNFTELKPNKKYSLSIVVDYWDSIEHKSSRIIFYTK